MTAASIAFALHARQYAVFVLPALTVLFAFLWARGHRMLKARRLPPR